MSENAKTGRRENENPPLLALPPSSRGRDYGATSRRGRAGAGATPNGESNLPLFALGREDI
jgi:hypothetical protein